jgi:hypothetical protein
MGGIIDNISCVPIRASKADTQPRNEVRSVVSAVPSCQRRRKASNIFAGSRFPASSRQRESQLSDSPPLERSGMMASLRVSGSNLRQQATKSSAGVSDHCGFTSEFGCFCPLQCSLRNGGGAEMADLTVIAPSSATGGASRRNADALPVRSIAGYC